MRSGNHQAVKKRLSGAKKRRRRAPRKVGEGFLGYLVNLISFTE
jgi:hypothetical protein